MGREYGIATVSFTPTVGAAKTAFELICAAEKPVKIRRLELSSDDTGGTTVIDVQLLRITAGGTATTVTARPLHQNDDAAGFTAKYKNTAEPTSGVNLWTFKWNIQVPYTLVLAPGEEFVIPGATNEGFAIEFLDDPGDAVVISLIVEEE
jgi:hypothetical protein